METVGLAYIILGLIVGGGIGWMLAKQRMGGEVIRSEERLLAKEEAAATNEEKVRAEIQNLVTDIGRKNSEDFLILAEERLGKVQIAADKDHVARKKELDEIFKPMTDSLTSLDETTKKLEKERVGAYHGLKRTVENLQRQTTDLRDTNVKLSTALRGSSKSRGDWGQISLRNVAESAGMTEHCDFDIEVTLASGAGGGRVDMLAKIPDGGNIPIDAKVPLLHIGMDWISRIRMSARRKCRNMLRL
jgi:DNA recombination protein RmuC